MFPRWMKPFAAGILAAMTLVLVTAQTPTRIDYGTQVRNGPSFVASLTAPLATTVASLPTGSILTIPAGTFPISTPVVIARNNLTIRCQPGATMTAAKSGINLFQVTGNNVWIDGCTCDGQKSVYTGLTGILVSAGVSEFTLTNSTFQNFSGTGLNILAGGVGDRIQFNHFLHFGSGVLDAGQNGILWSNQDRMDVSFNEFLDIGGDFSHGANDILSFTGGIYSFHDNYGSGIHRQAFEDQSDATPFASYINNRFDGFDNGTECLSLQNTPFDPPIAYSTPNALVVIGNSCIINNGVSAGGLGLEIFSDNAIITNNFISGDWGAGISLGGAGIVDGNVIEGGATGSHGFGITIESNVQRSTPLLVTHNAINNYRISGVSASANQLTISENTISRKPCFFADDSTNTFVGINPSANLNPPGLLGGDLVIAHNHLTITPGTTTCGFVWHGIAFGDPVNEGAIFDGNEFWNQNSGALGTAMVATNTGSFNGASIINQTYKNVTPGFYGGSTTLSYGNNKSFAGLGTAVNDYTIFSIPFSAIGDPTSVLPGSKNYVTDGSFSTGYLTGGSGEGGLATANDGAWTGVGNSKPPTCTNGASVSACSIYNAGSGKSGNSGFVIIFTSGGSLTNQALVNLTFPTPFPTGQNIPVLEDCEVHDTAGKIFGFTFSIDSVTTGHLAISSAATLSTSPYTAKVTCTGNR
jgi:hypothetical protein